MGNSQLLFGSIFKKDISATDAAEYLKTVVKEHPYFAPAQFYLLQLTSKADAEYYLQAAKTAIFFNNNYWLNYQLLQLNVPRSENAGKVITAPLNENVPATIENELETYTENIPSAEAGTEAIIPEEATIALTNTVEPAETAAPSDSTVTENELTEPETEKTAFEVEKASEEAAAPEETTGTKQQEIIAETVLTEVVAEEKTIEINSYGQLVESSAANNINQHTEETPELPISEDELTQKEEPANISIHIPKEDTDTREDSFIFEPLHTTDYFASVGIKLSEEAKPTDKLGIQLKSFTDWLKTMKKIAAAEQATDKIQSEQTDRTIQKLAEKSNAEGEVLTEAMADVLVQQGSVNKAIAVLEKLSLLNPSKSVFFAAKINQLKEQ